jgi:hypothetical protein
MSPLSDPPFSGNDETFNCQLPNIKIFRRLNSKDSVRVVFLHWNVWNLVQHLLFGAFFNERG